MKRRVARKIEARLRSFKRLTDAPYHVDQYDRAFASMRRIWVRGHLHTIRDGAKYCEFVPFRDDYYRMNRLYSAAVRLQALIRMRCPGRSRRFLTPAVCPRVKGLSQAEVQAFKPRRQELLVKAAEWRATS